MRSNKAGLLSVCLGLFIYHGCVDYSPIDLDGGKECVPDCKGKCCGDDGCGGTCPDECIHGLCCDLTSCSCVTDCGWECSIDSDCMRGKCCVAGRCVDMNCGVLECGPDPVCGFSCGTCPPGRSCEMGTCVYVGVCHIDAECLQDECCINYRCVDMNCGNLECGPDPVCGKECGPCPVDQRCVNGMCDIVVINQPGYPCSYGEVNESAGVCGGLMVCLGVPADGTAGTCPGGSASECTNLLDEWNPDCVDGNCGASFCSEECGANRTCPPGFLAQDVGEPHVCYCIPSPVNGPPQGNACPWGNVNTEYDDCAAGMACLGNDDIGSCPGGTDAECSGVPDTWNPDCVNGICGFSFCSAECDAQGNCPQGFDPADVSGTCYCIPDQGGSGQPGDPCPLGDVNYNTDFCASGLECLGAGPDSTMGTCPGGSSTECTDIPRNHNPDCVNGMCGFSLCAGECNQNGNCPAGFAPQDVAGTCFCIPA